MLDTVEEEVVVEDFDEVGEDLPNLLCTGKSWRFNSSSAFIFDRVFNLEGGEALRLMDFLVL